MWHCKSQVLITSASYGSASIWQVHDFAFYLKFIWFHWHHLVRAHRLQIHVFTLQSIRVRTPWHYLTRASRLQVHYLALQIPSVWIPWHHLAGAFLLQAHGIACKLHLFNKLASFAEHFQTTNTWFRVVTNKSLISLASCDERSPDCKHLFLHCRPQVFEYLGIIWKALPNCNYMTLPGNHKC